MIWVFVIPAIVIFIALLCGWAQGDFARDSDAAEGGDANAAPVPQDQQARAEGIAQVQHD